jgi:hypothetical protein
VALAAGNPAYKNAGFLLNPVRDAKAVAEAFRKNGFKEVLDGYNLNKRQFDALLMRFGDESLGAEWATVYFAGHGIAVGGETYVLPIGVALRRPPQVRREPVVNSPIRLLRGWSYTSCSGCIRGLRKVWLRTLAPASILLPKLAPESRYWETPCTQVCLAPPPAHAGTANLYWFATVFPAVSAA